jgi:hypothetical protein
MVLMSRRSEAEASEIADAQASAAAWATQLLGLAGEAFGLGVAQVQAAVGEGESLRPTVLLRGLDGAPLLAVDVFGVDPPAALRAERRRLFAEAGVVEYWQIAQKPQRARFFQRSAQGRFDEIPHDRAGVHYTMLAEEFAFPAEWVHEWPGLFFMLHTWGLVDGEEE